MNRKTHSYRPEFAKITARKELAPNIYSFRLKPVSKKPFHFKPGQFVMLSVLGFGEVPVGISSAPDAKGHFEVAVRAVGMVTNKICSLSVGEELGFSGPFGNGFPMERLKGRDVVIVAGGLGLPPLRSLIQHVELNPGFVNSLKILNGARFPGNLLYADEYPKWEEFAELHLTVDEKDDCWEGCVGQIPTLFGKSKVEKGSVMLVCGPPVMFAPVVHYFAGKRVAENELFLLLERRMKCGIGKCQHCTCGKEYVCLDGPVFSYDRIKYNKEAFS